jgi:hypothetical protein
MLFETAEPFIGLLQPVRPDTISQYFTANQHHDGPNKFSNLAANLPQKIIYKKTQRNMKKGQRNDDLNRKEKPS